VHDYPVVVDRSGVTAQLGSTLTATAALAKLHYDVGAGAGFINLTYRDASAVRDLSAPLSVPDDPANTGPNAPFAAANFPGAAVLTNSPLYAADVRLPLGPRSAGGARPAFVTLRHFTSNSAQYPSGIDPALSPYLLFNVDRIADDSLQYERALPHAGLAFGWDVRAETLTLSDALAPGPATQSQTQRSAVGRYEWTSGPRLHYTAAAYVSRYDTFGSSFDPRLAVVWTPTAQSVMRASVGTGFRAPLLTERVFNPNLTAEHTTQYELGWEQYLKGQPDRFHWALDLYRTNLRDPIFFTVDESGALTFLKNLGRVVYEGAELRIDKNLTAASALHASYGIDIAYPVDNPLAFDPSAPNVVAGQQFQGIPPHKGLLSYDRHKVGGLDYALDAAYESSNNELNRPAYVRLDANMGVRRRNTELTLYARNLTNAFASKFTLRNAGVRYPTPSGNAPTNAYALQGRSFTLTLTQRY
jgi:outer membrane receptor protein involved in Fe transport